jgi:hypothetical protein
VGLPAFSNSRPVDSPTLLIQADESPSPLSAQLEPLGETADQRAIRVIEEETDKQIAKLASLADEPGRPVRDLANGIQRLIERTDAMFETELPREAQAHVLHYLYKAHDALDAFNFQLRGTS